MKRIVSFSGGKDSTALLLMMLEKNMKIDRVINIDTTKEFPAMYEHIAKVGEYIKPLKIETLKIDFDYWFSQHILTKGENIGRKGYGWASHRFRWCSGLKIQAFNSLLANQKYNPRIRHLSKQSVINNIIYIGFNADESHRKKSDLSLNQIYPLIDWQITGQEALEYCYSKGFDWNGLYDDFERVSCYCCPLSRMGELRTIYTKYHDLWLSIKQMDKMSFRRFKNNYTIEQLESKFESSKKQMVMEFL